MATSPITCPNCGYKNYHPEATACEQCYAPLKPTAASEDSAGEGAKPAAKPKAKPADSKPARRPAGPPPPGGPAPSALNAALYALALPLSFPLAIGASLSGQRQREVAPGNWLLCGAVTLSVLLGIWYSQTGEGSAAWLVWPPVALFVCALFGGTLLVRTGEGSLGLVAVGAGLTGLAVYGGLQVMEPTPESLSGHDSPINAMAVTPGGDRMLTGSEDGEVRLWDLGSGHSVVLSGHQDGVAGVLWSPNADPVSIDYSGRVQVWKVDGEPASQGTWEAGPGVSCVALSPDGSKLAIGTLTGAVEARKATDGLSAETVLTGGAAIGALAYSPNGKNLAVGQINGALAVFGADEVRFEKSPESGVTSLAFVSDSRVVAGYASGEMRIWDVKVGGEVATLVGPAFPVLDVAVQGSTLVALHNNRTVVRWELGASNKEVGRAEVPLGRGGPANKVALLPSGDLLVSNGRAVSRVWGASLKK
ncbi:MAG: hypothetical protein KDD82_22115 [Planctomycetes bacterium]|nr:hypothetical protein [Planctomycetota bacterium]